jgi:hypothetical protein
MDYVVTLNFDPGPGLKSYLVKNAPRPMLARKMALAAFYGYNPGVDISVAEANGAEQVADSVEYQPLTSEQEEMVRYND